MDNELRIIMLIGFIILIGAILFEVVILGIAYFGADEVDCNFLWCEFKTTRSVTNQECYENGVKVNCSNMVDVDSIIKNAMVE